MKLLHFADTHVDAFTYGPVDPKTGVFVRVLDCLDMIDSMIDFAVTENVDLAIFAGDAFNRSNPSPLYLNEFSKRIIRLRKQCPVILLPGNHDMSRAGVPSAVEVFANLEVEGVLVGHNYELHIVETKSGKIQVATVPYPLKALLGQETLKTLKNGAEIRQALREHIEQIIFELGNLIEDTMPSVLVGHFAVGSSKYSLQARGEISPDDADISISSLNDPVWDYVALGHLHYHQLVGDGTGTPVVYAGSIDRVNFGEETESKGFVLVTLAEGKVDWEFIEVDARPYRTIEVHLPSYQEGKSNPNKAIMRAIKAADLRQAMVRVNIHVFEEDIKLIDRGAIHKALTDAGAFFIMAINLMPIRVNTTRYTTSEFNVTMRPEELLLKYFEAQGTKAIKPLMAMARRIMGGSEDANQ